MKYKDTKRFLTVSRDEVNKYIEYLLTARNSYIESGYPVDDVNTLLSRFMKLKRQLHA